MFAIPHLLLSFLSRGACLALCRVLRSYTFCTCPASLQIRDLTSEVKQPDMFLIHEKGKWCITFYVAKTKTMVGMGCFEQDVFNPGDITVPLMIAGAADGNTKIACRKLVDPVPEHDEL